MALGARGLRPRGGRRSEWAPAGSGEDGHVETDQSWVAWITKGDRVPYSREEVDFFAIVDGDLSVYMIPIHVVEGQSSVHVRRYTHYRLR